MNIFDDDDDDIYDDDINDDDDENAECVRDWVEIFEKFQWITRCFDAWNAEPPNTLLTIYGGGYG